MNKHTALFFISTYLTDILTSWILLRPYRPRIRTESRLPKCVLSKICNFQKTRKKETPYTRKLHFTENNNISISKI